MRIGLVFLILLASAAPASAMEACRRGVLDNCVIDGDTVILKGKHIRIANIDAPELRHPQCDAEKRLARVAQRRLVQLLSEGRIEIKVGDPANGRQRDRHGRTLALLQVDRRDLGEVMIDEGLARRWSGRREGWCAAL